MKPSFPELFRHRPASVSLNYLNVESVGNEETRAADVDAREIVGEPNVCKWTKLPGRAWWGAHFCSCGTSGSATDGAYEKRISFSNHYSRLYNGLSNIKFWLVDPTRLVWNSNNLRCLVFVRIWFQRADSADRKRYCLDVTNKKHRI